MKKMLNTLYVTSPDRYLSLDGENVVIQSGGKELGRVPLHNLCGIMTFGYAGVSPALLGKCADYGIVISFLSRSVRFLAHTVGPYNGNVVLRKTQYRYSENEEICSSISKNIMTGKLFNSRGVVERAIRDYSASLDIDKLKNVSD